MASLSRGTYIVLCIIVVCVVIELVLQAADWGFFAPSRLRQIAYEYGGFWRGLLDDWNSNYPAQPYAMFLSYGFLHSGIAHLIINMMTLWSLGQAVVRRVGGVGFSVIYAFSLLGGACIFALIAPDLLMVGASGALFGLAGALLSWMYVDRFNFGQGLLPVAQAVVLLILLNLLLFWAMDGQLAWQTHLGGFIAGWVAALLVDPRPVEDDA